MHSGIVAASCIALLGSAGFAGNEVTHGGMAEAMGLGHHHMMSDLADHCHGLHGGMMAMHNVTLAHQECDRMNRTGMMGA